MQSRDMAFETGHFDDLITGRIVGTTLPQSQGAASFSSRSIGEVILPAKRLLRSVVVEGLYLDSLPFKSANGFLVSKTVNPIVNQKGS